MVYIIWCVLGLLSLKFKKNIFVTGLVDVFIFIVFTFNTANADLHAYQVHYYGTGITITEPLYMKIGEAFYELGFNFEIYRGVLTVLIILLLSYTFYKLTPYPTLCLFMYSIYPMTVDVTQFRYTVAYAIAFFSIIFLIRYQEDRQKKWIFMFFGAMFLATGFHYSALLFAILGLLFLDIDKHKILYIIVVPLIVISGFTLIDKLSPYVTAFVGIRKAELWVSADRNSSMLRTARILLSRSLFIMFSVFLTKLKKNYQFIKFLGRDTSSIGLLYTGRMNEKLDNIFSVGSFFDLKTNRCLLICMLYIWLFSLLEITVAGDYERLSRLGVLVGGVLVTRLLYYIEIYNRKICMVIYLMIYAIYFVLIMFIFTDSNGTIYFDYVFRQVMESNSIFGTTYS